MRTCVYCKISVGGSARSCPICQNRLTGEATVDNWPKPGRLRTGSLLYKMQLFLVLSMIVTAVGLDYLLELHGRTHWSLVVSMWAVTAELALVHLFVRRPFASRVISNTMFVVAALLLVTARYVGFWSVTVDLIIPILWSVLLVVNLILSLVDRKSNAMVYLLGNILTGVVAFFFLLSRRNQTTLSWVVCLWVSVIALLATAVFRGRSMHSEVRKRLNL